MNDKQKICIGFDVGTTSVGWAVVDEHGKLLKYKNRYWYGVRTFEDAADEKSGDPKNLSRRKIRHTRRLIRRRKQRNKDFINLLLEHKYINDKQQFYEIIKNNKCIPLKLRVKGLKEKLNNDELYIALFNYLQHRGFFYDIDDDQVNDKRKNENIDKESLSSDATQELLEQKHPSEIQLQDYENNGYYVGNSRNQYFSNESWKKEIEVFLNNQKLDKDFCNSFIKLFGRIRDYSEGPGFDKHNPSIYGLFDKDGKKKAESLWDLKIGKCPQYIEEHRSVKKSGSAELFNILNDLNNLRLRDNKDWRIAPEQKQKILKILLLLFNQKTKKLKKLTLKQISKILNENEDNIYGYRIDKSKKPIFEEMFNTRLIYNLFKFDNFEPWNDTSKLKIINDIVELKSKNKKIDVIRDNIKNKILINSKIQIDDDNLNNLIKSLKGTSGAHSFSVKFLNELIPLLFKSTLGENQQNIILNNGFCNNTANSPIETLYINQNIALKEIIVSPTAKRAIRQTIKVFNKIVKFLHNEFDIESIAIEMARDKNSAEEKRNIIELQKIYEDRNKEVENSILELKQENNDLHISNIDEKNKTIKYKLWLWHVQNKYDVYDKRPIDYNDLVSHPNNYNVDHIIPYSKSFMNEKNNKVLTKTYNNKDKGERTPYQWFVDKGKIDKFDKLSLWWKDLFDKKNEKNSNGYNKFDYLVYKSDNFDDFIGRNLSDTRSATKSLSDIFKRYKNGHDKNIKIVSINGAITSYIRNDLNTIIPKKDRDLYRHHADDALVLAYLSTQSSILQIYRWIDKKKIDFNINIFENEKTGEIFNRNDFKEKFAKQYNEINLRDNPPSFSRLVFTKKKSAQFYNETLYSGVKDKQSSQIQKICKLDLIDSEKKVLKKYFGSDTNEKDRKSLFIYKNQHNRYLYDKLCEIYKEYDSNDNINPFVKYWNHNNSNRLGRCILIHLNSNTTIKIRKIKYFGKKSKSYFENIKINRSDNFISFYESFGNVGSWIFKNNDGKYEIKSITFREEFDSNMLSKRNIKNIYLPKNRMICLKNQPAYKGLFYIIGNNGQKHEIEIKPAMCLIAKYKNSINSNYDLSKITNNRCKISLNKLIKNFDIVELDELGNIHKKIDISRIL